MKGGLALNHGDLQGLPLGQLQLNRGNLQGLPLGQLQLIRVLLGVVPRATSRLNVGSHPRRSARIAARLM